MDKMIVYEDNVLLVVHKPVGIATETARVGQADLVSELKNYRKRKGEDTYIGVVHRLDQPVEGLLVFAKDGGTAKKLSGGLQRGTLTTPKVRGACRGSTPGTGGRTDGLSAQGRADQHIPGGAKGDEGGEGGIAAVADPAAQRGCLDAGDRAVHGQASPDPGADGARGLPAPGRFQVWLGGV